MDNLSNIFDKISTFDLLYLLLNIYFVLQCTKKGFVLSILSASKWILAYVITLYLFPKAKPYTEGILDNEYILDIVLGIILFILVIFIILSANFLYKFFYNKKQERMNTYINEMQKERIEKILNIDNEQKAKILESLKKDKEEGRISDDEFNKSIEILNKIK